MFTFIRNCPTFPKWLYCFAFSPAIYESSDCSTWLFGLFFVFVYICSYIVIFREFSKSILYVRLFWVEIFFVEVARFFVFVFVFLFFVFCFLRALDMWSTLNQTMHSFIYLFLPIEWTLHLEVYLMLLNL